MKSKIALFGLLFLALALVVTLPGAMAGDGGDDSAYGGGIGFGKKIAGTYFGTEAFGGSLTLNADGTVAAMSKACCGNSANIQSEAWGNWERTGEYQITLRTVAVGTNHDWLVGPTGNWVATPAAVVDFAEDFQSFTGSLCTALWSFDYPAGWGVMPNPDEDLPDAVYGPFPYNMTRLAVFQECP